MSEENIPTPWLDHYPEERSPHLEYPNETQFDQLFNAANAAPDSPALIFEDNILTYSELTSLVKRFAAGLQKRGLKKGDRVALMLPNTPHYVIAHHGVLAAGGIVVQVNPLYTPYELEHILADSGAEWMITLGLEQFVEKIEEVKPKTNLKYVVYGAIADYLPANKRKLIPILKFIPGINKKIKPILNTKKINWKDENIFNFLDFFAKEEEWQRPEINPKEDLALLQYTGGTTGLSKGAALTHHNLVANAKQVRDAFSIIPDGQGSVLTVLPLFHSFALTACMGFSLQLKIPMILMAKFDAMTALDLIEKYKISFVPGVPTMFVAINQAIKKRGANMESVIAAISGGAPLPLEVMKEFQELTNAPLVEGYGLSEASPVVTVNPLRNPRAGTIGQPVADTLIKIVDPDDGKTLKPIGEAGELCVKGPQVMKEYWNKPEETAKALRNGWLYTGDIAVMSEDGYISIVDRKKDMIIVSGYNVYPREVEEALYKHPAVLEAAVAGVSHPVKGEVIKAWVVLKEGMTATEEEIIAHCKKYVAPYKAPKIVEFRDELPKSLIGKILRRKLLEEEQQKQQQNNSNK